MNKNALFAGAALALGVMMTSCNQELRGHEAYRKSNKLMTLDVKKKKDRTFSDGFFARLFGDAGRLMTEIASKDKEPHAGSDKCPEGDYQHRVSDQGKPRQSYQLYNN